ncbi:MAG: hypothetical protein K0R14_1250 [Burkholderiales bacterium]|jgi:hypothetical protein|nr:hypothetical protein [Burkholderiales bacterium]
MIVIAKLLAEKTSVVIGSDFVIGDHLAPFGAFLFRI